jgi:hypothetical protein
MAKRAGKRLSRFDPRKGPSGCVVHGATAAACDAFAAFGDLCCRQKLAGYESMHSVRRLNGMRERVLKYDRELGAGLIRKRLRTGMLSRPACGGTEDTSLMGRESMAPGAAGGGRRGCWTRGRWRCRTTGRAGSTGCKRRRSWRRCGGRWCAAARSGTRPGWSGPRIGWAYARRCGRRDGREKRPPKVVNNDSRSLFPSFSLRRGYLPLDAGATAIEKV